MLDQNTRYQNLNIVSNAIELVVASVGETNSDDVKKTIDGRAATQGVLHSAIAARLQRRLRSHDYTPNA